MRDKLTPRQSRAWWLCALSVPAAMALARRGWLWVLAGSAAAGGIVLFLQTLQSSLQSRLPRHFRFSTASGLPFLQTISFRYPFVSIVP